MPYVAAASLIAVMWFAPGVGIFLMGGWLALVWTRGKERDGQVWVWLTAPTFTIIGYLAEVRFVGGESLVTMLLLPYTAVSALVAWRLRHNLKWWQAFLFTCPLLLAGVGSLLWSVTGEPRYPWYQVR